MVSNFTACVVAPGVSGDFLASEAPPNNFKDTSGQFELNNCFLQYDAVSLDNDLHNKYVAHLLDGKELPRTYHTYSCQSNSVVGQPTLNTTFVRSVSKLAAAFIAFNKVDLTGSSAEVHKEYNRFYHPMSRITFANSGTYDNDLDLEFQLQLGSKLFPEYLCKSITQACYYFINIILVLNLISINQIMFVFAMDMAQFLARVKPSGSVLTHSTCGSPRTTLFHFLCSFQP